MPTYPGRAATMNAPQFASGHRVGGGAEAWANASRARDALGEAQVHTGPRGRASLGDLPTPQGAIIMIGFMRDRVRQVEQARNAIVKSPASRQPVDAALPKFKSGVLAGLGATTYNWTDVGVQAGLGALFGLLHGKIVGYFGSQNYANRASGTPSTVDQIVAWGTSSPSGFWLNSIELLALETAGGWLRTSVVGADGTPSDINILDSRYVKFADGHWENRNYPGASLGTALATSSDPSHTIVGNVTSTIADVANSIASFLGDAVQELWTILQELGDDAEAAIELLGFLLDLASDVTHPDQLLGDINPFNRGGKAYNLIMDPTKSRVVDLVTIIVFAPLGLAFLVLAESLNVIGVPRALQGPAAAFTGHPNLFTQFLQQLLIGFTGATPKDQLEGVLGAVEVLIAAFTGGIQISMPALLQVSILVLTNIPLPPVGSIIETLLADPVVRQSLKDQGVPPQFADKILPIAMTCFQANSATQYLSCAQGVLELVFPGFIAKMQNEFFVNVNDLRVVIAAMWTVNGDFELLMDATAFPGVHEALVATGVLGVAHIAKTIVADVDGFLNSLKGVLPADLLQTLITGEQFVFHMVDAADAATGVHSTLNGLSGLGVTLPGIFTQGTKVATSSTAGGAAATAAAAAQTAAQTEAQNATTLIAAPLPAVAKRCIYHLQRSRWDVPKAVMSMRLDEYTTDIWKGADGGDGITPIQNVSLFRLIRVDPNDPSKGIIPGAQPLIDFLLKTFGAPLGHFLGDLVGDVSTALNVAQKSGVASGQQATIAAQQSIAVNKGITPSSSKSGLTTTVKPATNSSGFVSGAIAGGGAGFFVGGPVGAVIGSILGGALGSKAK